MMKRMLLSFLVVAIFSFAPIATNAQTQTSNGKQLPVMRLRDIGTRVDAAAAQNIVDSNSSAVSAKSAEAQTEVRANRRGKGSLLRNAFLADFNTTGFMPQIVFIMQASDPNRVLLPAGSTIVTTRLRPTGEESVEQYYSLGSDFTGQFGILVWHGEVLDGNATFGVYVRTPDGRSDSLHYYYQYDGAGRFPKSITAKPRSGAVATIVISGRFPDGAVPGVMIDYMVVDPGAIVLATNNQIIVDLTLDPQFYYLWGGHHAVTVKARGYCDTLSQYFDPMFIRPFGISDGNPPATPDPAPSPTAENSAPPIGYVIVPRIVGGLEVTDGPVDKDEREKNKRAKKQSDQDP